VMERVHDWDRASHRTGGPVVREEPITVKVDDVRPPHVGPENRRIIAESKGGPIPPDFDAVDRPGGREEVSRRRTCGRVDDDPVPASCQMPSEAEDVRFDPALLRVEVRHDVMDLHGTPWDRPSGLRVEAGAAT